MTAKIIYEVGEKLHKDSRLVYQHDIKTEVGRRKAKFICLCGESIITRVDGVKTGKTKSCGCLAYKAALTHGKSNTAEYRSWGCMIHRCTNKNNDYYANYGGRGITVCSEWRHSFEQFYADMGEKPEGTSIDRIDNDKGYSKENCRWATWSEQNRNRRDNNNITYNGRTQCIAAWAEELNLKRRTICKRIKLGWSIKKTLTTPVRGASNSKHISEI